jgi:hypothetical protein
MKGNIRKIIVGDSYSYNIKYLKGTEYRVGPRKCTITDFITNEDESIDIYVTDGTSVFIWKTIISKPLEIEYDVNFE